MSSSTLWKIPQFPVITLEFVHVKFERESEIYRGVIEKKKMSDIQPGVFTCTSHCEIDIGTEKHIVLWELHKIKRMSADSLPRKKCSSSQSEQQNQNDDTMHCLPFKVLGTCYSSDRQTALSEAMSYLEEYNRPVFAKLLAEPENTVDPNAIAVYIMSSGDYEKVGYIAKELTKYVHPVLNDPTLDVEVSKIRFSATYCMIGFYLTVDITKKGVWDKAVIRASKNVM
jgi:hypothetical protein